MQATVSSSFHDEQVEILQQSQKKKKGKYVKVPEAKRSGGRINTALFGSLQKDLRSI